MGVFEEPKLGRPGVFYNDAPAVGVLSFQSQISLNGQKGLTDQVLGHGWTLITNDIDCNKLLSPKTTKFWKLLEGYFLNVTPEVDIMGVYTKWFKRFRC